MHIFTGQFFKKNKPNASFDGMVDVVVTGGLKAAYVPGTPDCESMLRVVHCTDGVVLYVWSNKVWKTVALA